MTDVVLDTNALPLLYNEEYLSRVNENRDEIFITKYVWRKEARAFHSLQILYTSGRKLGRRFHHDVSVRRVTLPNPIDRCLANRNPDECDLKVARLAYDRRIRSGHDVSLVSDDHDFQNCQHPFQHYGISVRGCRQELNRKNLI